MVRIREILGTFFGSSMGKMTFPQYLSYVNSAGKITARSTMEILAVVCTVLENQETINDQNNENFKQIFDLLTKMVNEKPKIEYNPPPMEVKDIVIPIVTCPYCARVFKSRHQLDGHIKYTCDKKPNPRSL